jgi:hypothetical protein
MNTPLIIMFIYCSILTIFVAYLIVKLTFKNNKIVILKNKINEKDATIIAISNELKKMNEYLISNQISSIFSAKSKKKKKTDDTENNKPINEPQFNIDEILNEISQNGGTEGIAQEKLDFLKKFRNNNK